MKENHSPAISSTKFGFNVNLNKGIGGIEGCNHSSIKWLLVISTVPIFFVVCVLPAAQTVQHPIIPPVVPLEQPPTVETLYSYGTDLSKALSFRNVNPSPEATHCKVAKTRSEDSTIVSVRVVGERHSGAPWLLRQFTRQLPNVTVGGGLLRGKNWFQTEDNLKQVIYSRHGLDGEAVDQLLNNVLVVVITRSPYEWMLAMQKRPIHAPNHLVKDWKRFVSKPWTIPTVAKDKLISRTKGAWCQLNFFAGEVTPCRTNALVRQQSSSKKYPVYEHHPVTHKPFKNILELRRAKMTNYLNLTNWLPHVKFVTVESLIDKGVDSLMEELHEEYGLAYCPSQIDDKNFELQISGESLDLHLDEMKYLTCKLQWDIEKKFGYEPNMQYLENKKTKKIEKCRDSQLINSA